MQTRFALILVLSTSLSLGAQQPVEIHDARVGSDLARYLRAAELSDSALGPWRVESTTSRVIRWGAMDLRTGFNTGLPTAARDDGPAWAGNGGFVQLTGSASWSLGPLRARVAPVLWWSQNADVLLVPFPGASPTNPYADPMRPSEIDLPQQFGEGYVARLDPGESEVVAEWALFRAAATTASRRVGPGVEHTLLMQGDAGGFPRLEFGTPDAGIRTPIGRVHGVLGSGRIAQSAFSPATRTAARHGSFIDVRWSPLESGKIELGAARFYHRDWMGFRAKDFLVPLGSLFFDEQVSAGGDADNQLATLYGRLKVPQAGLELYAEFGKNDRSSDTRDLLIELEHNAAWLAGVQRTWTGATGELWAMNAVMSSARIAEFTFLRGQATFYEHSPIRQGHTSRGQLLGTPLLQGTGGAELRIDRYTAQDRRALILHTRILPNRRPIPVAEEQLRSEWGLMTEWMRNTSRGAVYARLGGLADINRHPTEGDVYSLHLTLGYTLRP